MKNNILDKIKDYKISEVEEKKLNFPQEDIVNLIKNINGTRGFQSNLKEKNNNGYPGIIAEVKKASPSKGIIKQDFNHIDIANDYEAGNASCISVLTDFPSFQGKLEFLKDIHENVNLPLLRKDFMIDPYQVYEARLYRADCILIIMKMVNQETANELNETAKKMKMDVIFEVNNEDELNKALDLKPKMIGINNRDLRTFKTDLNNSINLSKKISDEITLISESGISERKDIELLLDHNIRNFLIGESIMKSSNIINVLKSFTGKY